MTDCVFTYLNCYNKQRSMFNMLFILNNQSKVRENRRYMLLYIIPCLQSLRSQVYNRVNSDRKSLCICIYICKFRKKSQWSDKFFFLVKEMKSKIELISQKSTSVFSSSASFCNQNTWNYQDSSLFLLQNQSESQ